MNYRVYTDISLCENEEECGYAYIITVLVGSSIPGGPATEHVVQAGGGVFRGKHSTTCEMRAALLALMEVPPGVFVDVYSDVFIERMLHKNKRTPKFLKIFPAELLNGLIQERKRFARCQYLKIKGLQKQDLDGYYRKCHRYSRKMSKRRQVQTDGDDLFEKSENWFPDSRMMLQQVQA